MKKAGIENTFAFGASFLTIVAPKFCCWGSAIAAMSGGVSYLAWVHPMRPYLFALSFLMVGYSFYRAYRPGPWGTGDCSCNSKKKPFFSSKGFTWVVAVFVLVTFLISYTTDGL